MNVELQHISKSFGRQQVLHDVSLTASDGEILCLLGPSGSGKTTLIRLIIGATLADSGEIMIGGRKCPNREVVRHIGFMPQNDAIYPDLSGMDNLLFFGRLFGIRREKLKEKAEAVLNLTQLADDGNKLVPCYSGGMRKRLSLAVALLHGPEILILDEPTVGIDPVLRRLIWDEFERLRQKGVTIIISTHVMDEANRCQKVAMLYEGSLIEYDTVERLNAKTDGAGLESLFLAAGKEGNAQ